MDTILLNLLFKLNKELSLKVSKHKLEKLLLSHPNYPSIFSLSDTLTKLGIENKSGNISVDQLLSLSPLFMAYTLQDGLVLVKKISKNEISYYTGNYANLITESLKDFLLKWNGIVLLFDTEPKLKVSGEEITNKRFKSIKILASIIILLVIMTASLEKLYQISNLFFLTKFAGTLISMLIIFVSANKINQSKYCSSNNKMSCNDVLNSRASNIFSWLSMSDLGLVYFIGCFLSLIIGAIDPNSYTVTLLISFLSVSAFPYIFFSIIYQKYVVKKWCALCLGIQGLFFIEFFIAIYILLTNDLVSIPYDSIFMVIIIFGLVSIIWSYLKSPLYKYYKNKEENYKYRRIKNNPDVFSFLQEKENTFDTQFIQNPIVFGDNDSKNMITMVINPYCQLCAEKVNEIVTSKKAAKNFNFSLIFSESKNSEASLILIELYHRMGKSDFLTLLKNWFVNKDLKKLKENYYFNISEKTKNTFEQHVKWCSQYNIIQTPLTIFNNRSLSDHYSLHDLLIK